MRIDYGYGDCDKILNINYDDREDFDRNKVEHILTAYKDKSNFVTYNSSFEGASLYKGDICSGYVYKIYYDVDNYKNSMYDDSRLINNLLEKQDNVFLTKFPIGIVTIGKYQIGQIIPYYKDYITINSMFSLMNGFNDIEYKYYLDIIKIFLELYNNGIYYTDIHFFNILIKRDLSSVKLIDFEQEYMGIDDEIKREEMIIALKKLYYYLNLYLGIEDEVIELDGYDNIYDMIEVINKNHKLLRKRKEKKDGLLYYVWG